MAKINIKIGRQCYKFQRSITQKEYELFRTHKGADKYYFKKMRGVQKYWFYVTNNTNDSISNRYKSLSDNKSV